MWIYITVYLVVSLLALTWLASNTDEPPANWKQWLVALLMGGPWMLLLGLVWWCQDHILQVSGSFNDWWNSLK